MLTKEAEEKAKKEFDFWWETSDELKTVFKGLETNAYLRDKLIAWEAFKAAWEIGAAWMNTKN